MYLHVYNLTKITLSERKVGNTKGVIRSRKTIIYLWYFTYFRRVVRRLL